MVLLNANPPIAIAQLDSCVSEIADVRVVACEQYVPRPDEVSGTPKHSHVLRGPVGIQRSPSLVPIIAAFIASSASLKPAFMGHASTQMTAGVYDWARFSELEARAREVLDMSQKRPVASGTSEQQARATQDSNLRPSAPEASTDKRRNSLSGSDNNNLAPPKRTLGERNWRGGRPEFVPVDRFELLGAAVAVFARNRARRAA